MNKKGMEEVGYIYTTMISSLFLGLMLIATSNATNEVIRTNAFNEMKEVVSKVSSAVEMVAEISQKNPNATCELPIELPKTIKSYSYTITLQNGTVKIESDIGITIISNLRNLGNINTTGSVGGGYLFVKVIYQKGIISIKGA